MKLKVVNSLFIVAMVIISFTSVTFAAWTRDLPPPEPEPGIRLSCTEWILFYKFNPNSKSFNRQLAGVRDFKLDRTVFLWTASYVYILSRSSNNLVLPSKFCAKRGLNDNVLLEFLALEDEKRTCEDWILFYGYDPDILLVNNTKANIRKISMDFYISIWAAGYARLITQRAFNYLLPAQYCHRIGLTEENTTRFMTYNSTLMSCEDWIKLYDYTDDPTHNYYKALSEYNPQLDLHRNRWVVGYSTELCSRGLHRAISPATYCDRQIDGLTRVFYFSDEDTVPVSDG